MYFTAQQLTQNPDLRPPTWSSEKSYQQDRLYLLNALLEHLHQDPETSTTTRTSIDSNRTITAEPLTSQTTPHTPRIFSSPQTSTFTFKDLECGVDKKVDSVMGSPMALSRIKAFKKKPRVKITEFFPAVKSFKSKSDGGEGSKTSITDYFKSFKKDSKHTSESRVEEKVEMTKSGGQDEVLEKGMEYVVEHLGLEVEGLPRPVSQQYLFVKNQIQKSVSR